MARQLDTGATTIGADIIALRLTLPPAAIACQIAGAALPIQISQHPKQKK